MDAQRCDAEVKMLNNSLKTRSFWLLIGVAFLCGTQTVLAQSSTRADLPGVDLPSPAVEASPFPAMEEVVPPSVSDGAVQPYLEAQPTMDSATMMDSPPMESSGGGTPIYEDGYAQDGAGHGYFEDGPHCNLDYPAGSVCGDCEPAPIYSTGTWFRRGNWYFDFDYVHMTRENPREVLIINDTGFVGDLLNRGDLSTNDLVSHRYRPGGQLRFGRFLGRDVQGRDHAAEFAFFGLLDWEDSRLIQSSTGGAALQTTLTLSNIPNALAQPFFGNTSQTYSHEASFNSAELNYRIDTRPGRDVLALQPNGAWVRHGIASRVTALHAGMRIISFDEGVDYRGFNGAALSGDYSLLTNNDLFGLHAGIKHTEKHDEWSWGFNGRIGGLANFAQRRSLVTNGAGATLGSETVSDEQAVFSAEAGFFTTYQLRPNLHFRAGYNFLFLTGLAIAPENLGLTNGFDELNVQGSLLMHGGIFGFETTW